MFCRSTSSSTGMCARWLATQRFLLRHFERGGGAGFLPLPDQGEHAARGLDVLVRDPQPVLRCQHQEIGGRDADDGADRDHVAVEARGDGVLLRGARGRAVLAPEIDLVAGGEGDAIGGAIGPAGGPRARHAGVEIGAGQQRRAGDLALRVGLDDPRDRGRDVEIRGLRFLDQRGELARAKAAPPVERRRRRRCETSTRRDSARESRLRAASAR